MLMGFVVITSDGCILKRAVHPLHRSSARFMYVMTVSARPVSQDATPYVPARVHLPIVV